MAATGPGHPGRPRVSGLPFSGASGAPAFAGGRLSGGPGFAEAVRLARLPDSSLVSETRVRHLALFPGYLGRLRSGIAEQLGAGLQRFSDSLKGVPLAYDNVKLLSALGDMIDEQGYIHIDVQADFVIFRPKAGDILKGVVNKVGAAHVGCLVHGCFNASLDCPRDAPDSPWPAAELAPGDTLRFAVTHVDSDWAGVLLVRGSLGVPDESNAEQANGAIKHEEEEVHKVPAVATNSTASKKRKEMKNHVTEVEVTTRVEEEEEEAAVENDRKERKKNKKKSKRKGESDGEEPNSRSVTEILVKEEPRAELWEIGGLEETDASRAEAATPSLQKRKISRPSKGGEEETAAPRCSSHLDEGLAVNGTLTSDLEAPEKNKKRKRSLVEDVSLSESPLPRAKRRK